MEHTEKCLNEQAAHETALAEFTAKYPNHCRVCGGTGVHNYDEDVAGDGGSRMQFSEPCSGCTEKSICPLCGKQHDENWGNEDDGTTWSCECGWKWVAEVGAPVSPGDFECYCWDRDYEPEPEYLV